MSLVFLQTEGLKFSRLFMTCAFLFDRSTLGQTNHTIKFKTTANTDKLTRIQGLNLQTNFFILGSLRLHQRSTKKKFELLTRQIYQKFELPKDFLTVQPFVTGN